MSTSTPSRFFEFGLMLREGTPVRLDLIRRGMTMKLDAVLKADALKEWIVLSAWSDDPPLDAVVEKLRAAGFRIAGAFGPGTEKEPWRRRDLGGEVWEEPPPEPLRFEKLLFDTPEQRVKFPSPFRDGVGFVTIHNTAEPFSAVDERLRVVYRRNILTSFHFAVDEHRCIQLLPLDRHGWHAGDGDGDGNLRSIGIEICRSVFRGENDWLYRRAEENATTLAAALLWVLKLTPAELRMHRDWSGKYCPHRILEENAWTTFTARVTAKRDLPATHRLAEKLVAS